MIEPDDLRKLARVEYAPIYGAMMAFLRAWQRGKRWQSRFIEGGMMGLALLCIVPTLESFGVSPAFSLAFAGWAGYVGVDTLADWAAKRMGV